jgi:hypothetical protein
MEKMGVPTAVICTAPFISSAKAMALAHGFADYPFAVVPHPINVTPPEQLKTWVKEVVDRVESILSAKAM